MAVKSHVFSLRKLKYLQIPIHDTQGYKLLTKMSSFPASTEFSIFGTVFMANPTVFLVMAGSASQ